MTRQAFAPIFTLAALLLAQAAPAQAQTLDEALVKAYSENPDLLAARAALRAVDEQGPQARAGYRPTVSGAGSIGTVNRDSQAAGNDDFTPKSMSLSVEQPLYRGGRTMAAIRQADANIAAQRASLLNSEQSVLLGGVNSYLNVLRDQAVLDLNQNNENVLQRQLRAARDRFSVGEVTRTDVSQAESRASAARSGRIQAEGTLSESRASFERVFGTAPGTLAKPAVKLTLPESREAAIEAAQNNNPVVLAAMNSKTAAEALLDAVKGERLPTLAAEGSLARSIDSGSSSSNRVDTASALLNLTVPLYQAGSTSSRIREARQTVSQRSQLRDSAERQATEAATQAWEQWKTAQAIVISRKDQVEAAQVALDGVQEEAKVGSRTVLDTLDAEQELLDARVGLVRAEYAEILAQYSLLSAIGRLTAKELQLAVESYDETAYSNRVRSQWIGSGTGD
jgi:TolC family type I secretion outer membrane protein